MTGERRSEKEDIVVGTGRTTRLMLSMAYTKNRRTTMTTAVTMTTTMTIGTTWRRRNRRRTMTVMMT